jgi:hypothetical protein
MSTKDDNLDWIGPLFGFIGLLAGSLFLSSQQNNNQNLPPPPPINQRPPSAGDCGCTAKKT